MTSLITSWLNLGCDRAATATLKRKILNVNATTLLVLIAVFFYHMLCLVMGDPGLIKASAILIPFYPLIAIAPWLNHLGHDHLARWTLTIAVTSTILFNIVEASGSVLGLHFYFISVIVVAPMYFSLRQWRSMAIIFIINTVLFIYFEYIYFPPTPEVLNIDINTIRILKISHASTSLLIAIIISFVRDIGASKNENDLEELSHIDALTGLPNRRRMVQRLSESLATSKRTGQYCAVIYLDLDNFKPLNDQHGHATGDLLLKEVARHMKSCLREIDVVARFGGDEFVVMLTVLGKDADDAKANARLVAEKIRGVLAKPYRLVVRPRGTPEDIVEHHCTASLGVVVCQGKGTDGHTALTLADAAMYRAKENGRNVVVFHHDPE